MRYKAKKRQEGRVIWKTMAGTHGVIGFEWPRKLFAFAMSNYTPVLRNMFTLLLTWVIEPWGNKITFLIAPVFLFFVFVFLGFLKHANIPHPATSQHGRNQTTFLSLALQTSGTVLFCRYPAASLASTMGSTRDMPPPVTTIINDSTTPHLANSFQVRITNLDQSFHTISKCLISPLLLTPPLHFQNVFCRPF